MNMATKIVRKGQCHEILDHFIGLKDSIQAPYKQAKTVSQKKKIFAEKFDRKVRKSGVRVVYDYMDIRFFPFDTQIFVFLNYCYWVCKLI